MGAPPDPVSRLAQADLMMWLARALGPPTAAWRIELVDGNDDALLELARRSALGAGSTRLLGVAAELRETPIESLAMEHARLFDAALACPPNETAYVRRDKGAILADVAGFYRAFGFELDGDAGEKADHVVAELQFGALLLIMWARAQADGDRDGQEVTRRALATFAEDHLGVWLQPFCERLAGTTRASYYAELATLLGQAWAQIVAENGLPVPAELGPGPVPENHGCYDCGGPPSQPGGRPPRAPR